MYRLCFCQNSLLDTLIIQYHYIPVLFSAFEREKGKEKLKQLNKNKNYLSFSPSPVEFPEPIGSQLPPESDWSPPEVLLSLLVVSNCAAGKTSLLLWERDDCDEPREETDIRVSSFRMWIGGRYVPVGSSGGTAAAGPDLSSPTGPAPEALEWLDCIDKRDDRIDEELNWSYGFEWWFILKTTFLFM